MDLLECPCGHQTPTTILNATGRRSTQRRHRSSPWAVHLFHVSRTSTTFVFESAQKLLHKHRSIPRAGHVTESRRASRSRDAIPKTCPTMWKNAGVQGFWIITKLRHEAERSSVGTASTWRTLAASSSITAPSNHARPSILKHTSCSPLSTVHYPIGLLREQRPQRQGVTGCSPGEPGNLNSTASPR